jgi:hypothetical protein
VTNWILWQSALPVRDAVFGRKRHSAEPRQSVGGTQGHMRQIITRLMKQVYKEEGCIKTELVPLGEIAKDNY